MNRMSGGIRWVFLGTNREWVLAQVNRLCAVESVFAACGWGTSQRHAEYAGQHVNVHQVSH